MAYIEGETKFQKTAQNLLDAGIEFTAHARVDHSKLWTIEVTQKNLTNEQLKTLVNNGASQSPMGSFAIFGSEEDNAA